MLTSIESVPKLVAHTRREEFRLLLSLRVELVCDLRRSTQRKVSMKEKKAKKGEKSSKKRMKAKSNESKKNK